MKGKTVVRRLIAVVAILALAFLGMVTAAPQAQAATRHKISIGVNSRTITQNSWITISGKVRPALGSVVRVQKKWPGKSWRTIATVPMGADGSYRYSYQVTNTQKRQYRAVAPKAGKVAAGTSKAISVTVRPSSMAGSSVTITGTGPTSITAGQNFQVSGQTSANLAGKRVELQLAGSAGWSTIGSAVVAANATFTVAAPAWQAGAGQSVRVFAPQTPTTYASTSGSAAFTVYGWYYLSEMDQLEGSFYTSSTNVNGQTYTKALNRDFYWDNSTSTTQFDLGRKCIHLAATAGWSDHSAANVIGAGRVYSDSVTVWNSGDMNPSGIKLGTSYPIDVDITGVLRLKLEATYITGSDDATFVFGDARVLCAF